MKVDIDKLIKVSRKCAESEDPKGFFENSKNAVKFFKNLPAVEGSAKPEVVAVFLSVPALKGLKKYIKYVRETVYTPELRDQFKLMKNTLEEAIFFAGSYKEGQTDRLEKELAPIITSAINIAQSINDLHIEDEDYVSIDDDMPLSEDWVSNSPIGSGLDMVEQEQE